MWKVWGCIAEARDDNYSNPDDFPLAYAQRVWLSPLFLTPFLWPAFLTDNPTVLAYMLLPLSVFNVILLLTVMPVWRRGVILSQNIDDETEADTCVWTITNAICSRTKPPRRTLPLRSRFSVPIRHTTMPPAACSKEVVCAVFWACALSAEVSRPHGICFRPCRRALRDSSGNGFGR